MKNTPILLILLLFILNACQSNTSSLIHKTANQIQVTNSQAAIVGQVYSTTTNKPLSDTVVWLAKVHWNEDHSEGAYVLDGAAGPTAISDKDGIFVFKEIKPAEYVIVVGDLMGENVVILNEEGDKVKIYTANAGEVLEVETLNVDLPR